VAHLASTTILFPHYQKSIEPTISIANALSVEQKDNQDLGIPTRLVEGEVDEHTDRSCMRPSQNIFIS
jgi:hypothetical protein